MTAQFQPGSMNYTQGFGSSPDGVAFPHIDVRAPAVTDILYPLGKRWIDRVGNAEYTLTSISVAVGITSANWVQLANSGSVSSVVGTANQVTATTSIGAVTLSLPNAITAPGSLTTTTSLTATLGDITATNGNIVRGTAGNKDVYTSVASTIAAGANSAGTVTLIGGTVTISTTAVTANSLIRLTRQSVGATGAAATGNLSIGTITAGVSFVINSVLPADATNLATNDVSIVFWELVN